METNKAIGSYVSRLRQFNNINQVAMAEVLDIDQSALSRVENGKQMLTAVQWHNFCVYMKLKAQGLPEAVQEQLELEGLTARMEKVLKKKGFKNEKEFIKLVTAVELTNPETRKEFAKWKKEDGSKEGLVKIGTRSSI